MRRLAALLCAALLALAVPSAGVLASPTDDPASSLIGIAADETNGVCDIKASLEDGPMVDDMLSFHVGEDYEVHGFGFPANTPLAMEVWEDGTISDTFDTETDANGEFIESFWTWGWLSSPSYQTFTVYDPANSATCRDSVGLRWMPTGWTPFTDISGSQFKEDIHWLYDSGITKGCSATQFCPDLGVTRGQMAAFLVRALGLPPTSTDFFTDDEASMFEGDINRLAAAGITAGCTSTTFCPGVTITREQMAAFLDRALSLPPTATDYFTDDESSMFEANINRMAAAGITAGCTATTFCPKGTVTRGQMAAFLHRALD